MALLHRLGMKRRLNLVIPERAFDRLNWLQGRTDAASHTEVIRNALFAYEILVERVAAGSVLMEKTAKCELLPLPIAIDVLQPRIVAGRSTEPPSTDPLAPGREDRPVGGKGRRLHPKRNGTAVAALT
jgi:hypothetical protein